MSVELKPHEREALLNQYPVAPVRVFQKVVDSKLKVQSPESEVRSPEDSITAAEVLRDARGIMARALARGAAKVVFHAPVKTGRDHEHKTGRRWSDLQRARWKAKLQMRQEQSRNTNLQTPNTKHQTPTTRTTDCIA